MILFVNKGGGTADHFAGFVGADDINRLRAGGGDDAMTLVVEAVVVLRVANLEAEIAKAGDDVAADFGVALADGSGEDEGVDALEGGGHLGDRALEAIDIHLIGELRAGVAVVAKAQDLAHIVGLAADAF